MISAGVRGDLVVVFAFALAGCATVAPAVQKLPGGSSEKACAEPFGTCPEAFEGICGWAWIGRYGASM